MNIPREALNLVVGVSILIGAVQCFFGYRIFKVVLAFIGFVLGAMLGGAGGYAASQEELVGILCAVVGGCIGAALMVLLYFVGVFLLGALLGAGLGALLFAVADSEPMPAVLVILAVMGGVVAILLQKLIIIVGTSFGGAWNVVVGFAYFTTHRLDPTNVESLEYFMRSGGGVVYAVILCWILLGIAGVVVQYVLLPKRAKHKAAGVPVGVPRAPSAPVGRPAPSGSPVRGPSGRFTAAPRATSALPPSDTGELPEIRPSE
jgi:hypothetical protein